MILHQETPTELRRAFARRSFPHFLAASRICFRVEPTMDGAMLVFNQLPTEDSDRPIWRYRALFNYGSEEEALRGMERLLSYMPFPQLVDEVPNFRWQKRPNGNQATPPEVSTALVYERSAFPSRYLFSPFSSGGEKARLDPSQVRKTRQSLARHLIAGDYDDIQFPNWHHVCQNPFHPSLSLGGKGPRTALELALLLVEADATWRLTIENGIGILKVSLESEPVRILGLGAYSATA